MSNVATLSQGKHLVEVFEALESGQLQALIASGLLTDLRRCAAELDPTKVDRDQYQRILGLDSSIFKVKMGGNENTDQIVAVLREGGIWVNGYVTQANFPLTPSENLWEDEIKIIDPECSFNEGEGLKFIADAKLRRPTYEHGIRFAQQHGKATTSTKKPFVIFLHEPWQDPDRRRRMMSLYRNPESRKLSLDFSGQGFYDAYCVLAGVLPRKQPLVG